MKASARFQHGFTLIELLVVMGMMTILLAISVVAISRPQAETSVQTVTTTLVADLKDQQLLAMEGDSGVQANAQAHGIRIVATGYTLFIGSTFINSTDQFNINFPPGISAGSATLPLDIIFASRSGETAGVSSLLIQDRSGDTSTLTMDRLGAIDVH